VNFELTDEQVMLRDAAKDAVSRLDTVAGARAALDGQPLPDIWPTACEAGWPGLLVPEDDGGAGLGAFDAMLVLEECGKRLTGAGLLGHLPATLVLARAGGHELLPALAAGELRAAIVHTRPPTGDEGWTVEAPGLGAQRIPAVAIDADGRLHGTAGFQPDLAGADVLVVPVLEAAGELRVAVVEADAPGVTLEGIVRYDASRPLAHVTFDGAAGAALDAGAAAVAEAWFVVQALMAAELLGVCQTMLDLSVAYAKDRHAFGRPIGSYQAVKQQIVEILRYTDTARNLCYYAAYAAESNPAELALATSAARFAGEQGADYATRTCIAVHGGIGATWEHDAPFFWRRAQLSRLLLGGIADASDRVAEEIISRAREHAATAASTH
jgi:alkylation response protein AidB-like acyl-CoA dehydrogenase